MCNSNGICAAIKACLCSEEMWIRPTIIVYHLKARILYIVKHLAASQFQFWTEFHKVCILPVTFKQENVNPYCPLWKIVTVFQSKRKRLSMHCTIQTSQLCLRCVEFFQRMICRHFMFKKFSGDSRLLPRFTYIPKYIERRLYCILCKLHYPVTLHIVSASKNLGFGHRPISRPRSF